MYLLIINYFSTQQLAEQPPNVVQRLYSSVILQNLSQSVPPVLPSTSRQQIHAPSPEKMPL